MDDQTSSGQSYGFLIPCAAFRVLNKMGILFLAPSIEVLAAGPRQYIQNPRDIPSCRHEGLPMVSFARPSGRG